MSDLRLAMMYIISRSSQIDTSANASLFAHIVQSYLTLNYQFALDTNRAFPAAAIAADTVVDSLASVKFRNLRRNEWYFWHVRAMAMDRSDSSLWSNIDSFFVAPGNMAPTVNVTAPNGGESWIVGALQDITWTDMDDIGVTAHKLEYSIDGGTNWLQIRDWTDGDPHTYAWTIPGTVSIQSRVKVSCRDASNNIATDLSNSNFTIQDDVSPSVTVINPNGRERWYGNNIQNITWTDSDNLDISSYRLEYTANSGSNWNVIIDWTSGDPHTYAWTVPNISSRSCLVRVLCGDASGNIGSDASDRLFAIRLGSVPVISGVKDSSLERDQNDAYNSDSSADTSLPVLAGSLRAPGQVPNDYYLAQSYPNPFNAQTNIEYGLPVASPVRIEIYDVLGRDVETLIDETQEAGYHHIIWNAGNYPSGMYLCRINAGHFAETRKMLLVK